jgi:hypothetical protein
MYCYDGHNKERIMTYHPDEKLVVAHTADTASEAMVIRGLLESAGIHSPEFGSADPFPLNEAPEGTHGPEILVRESQAAEAKKLIAEYAKGNAAEASSTS